VPWGTHGEGGHGRARKEQHPGLCGWTGTGFAIAGPPDGPAPNLAGPLTGPRWGLSPNAGLVSLPQRRKSLKRDALGAWGRDRVCHPQQGKARAFQSSSLREGGWRPARNSRASEGWL